MSPPSLAAARAGAPTWLVGCVGTDPFGGIVSSALRSHGVGLSEVRSVGNRTGVAHIRVDASGENDIVMTPLANADLGTEMVDESIRAVRACFSSSSKSLRRSPVTRPRRVRGPA
ncbi:PfkB family carbohydrate kinase [Nonomuraea sp. NPDC001699]